MSASAPRQYCFDGYRLDAVTRELRAPDDSPIALTPKSLDVLLQLVEHRDRIIDKDQLLQAVWPGRVVEENNLTQAISSLRKAFGVSGGDHRYIVTVPGRGYRFVADTVMVDGAVAATEAPPPARPGQHEAQRLYLAARDLNDAPSLPRLRRAIGIFRQVLDLDPGFALAWSGLAFAWRALTMTGDTEPVHAFKLANAAVDHALALDPQLAEAYAARGFNLFWHAWDWPDAEAAMCHAIALNPDVADGYFALAHLLNNLGRFEEALVQVRLARERDPLSPLINTLEGGFLAAAQRPREAQVRIAHALEVAPDFWVALLARAAIAQARGDPGTALDDLERAAVLSARSSQVLAMLGIVHAQRGDQDQARQLLEELQGLAAAGFIPATSQASIHNALGEHDRALDLLELAYEQRDVRMTFLKVDARWNSLRDTPRFQALMARMGFVDSPAHGRL